VDDSSVGAWFEATVKCITSMLPVIRPESMPSGEITSYKPTYQDESAQRGLHVVEKPLATT
jgi:hypothetical protein